VRCSRSAVAAWVAVTLRPYARQAHAAPLDRLQDGDKITRAGWIYILGTLLVALAALNTGNNLLFSNPCVSYLRHPDVRYSLLRLPLRRRA